MQKTMILPILGLLNILVQAIFGVKIEESVLNDLAINLGNVISGILVIYGIFKNHKKEGKEAS